MANAHHRRRPRSSDFAEHRDSHRSGRYPRIEGSGRSPRSKGSFSQTVLKHLGGGGGGAAGGKLCTTPTAAADSADASLRGGNAGGRGQ